MNSVSIYVEFGGGKVMKFPVNPSKLIIRNGLEYSEVSSISGKSLIIPEASRPTEVSFSSFFPAADVYCFAQYGGKFIPPSEFLEHLNGALESAAPVILSLLRSGAGRFQSRVRALISNLVTREEGGTDDVYFDIVFVRYETPSVNTSALVDGLSGFSNTGDESAVASATATYTVQKGDTLYAIAKRFLGDGSRYPEIAELNGIMRPSLIYPGQVLILLN